MVGVEGKVIAITGSSSGIGEAAARRLAKEGAKVVLGARRTDLLEAVTEDIKNDGGEASFTPLDVTDRQSVAAFVKFALDTYQRLDVLVSNAGVMPLSPMIDGKVDEWEWMIDVNIKSVLFGIAAALPVFAEQNSGQFVQVTSGADRAVGPTAAVYSGTKFAVRAISDGLRMEAGPNIRVAVIAPGATATKLPESISNPEQKQAFMAAVFANPNPPDSVAQAISYVISQPADVEIKEVLLGPRT